MDSGAILISFLFAIGIGLVIFLILRAVMLWYWKIDVIVDKLERIANATELTAESRRKQHRINYYVAVAKNDNQEAYVSIMNIVLDDILKTGITQEARKDLYNKNKERFALVVEKLGYEFPEYDSLFSLN